MSESQPPLFEIVPLSLMDAPPQSRQEAFLEGRAIT
jgi:hypothetical protein